MKNPTGFQEIDGILAYQAIERLVSKKASLLPPATKLRQGYIFTGICDSVHRGGGMRGGGNAWLGGVHGCSGACVTCMPPHPGQILRLRHTVNERAVRILLECILVVS